MGACYEEHPARHVEAVRWSQRQGRSGGHGRVLPDGCLDLLLWNGELVVAGPDTRAHLVPRRAGDRVDGLRFAPGLGPRVLGVPAHELRDRRVPLDALWSGPQVRRLAERAAAAADPGEVLERAAARALTAAGERGRRGVPGGPPCSAVVAGLRAGRTVARVADDTGLDVRRLHRFCLHAFGYGPKTLARVLRMRRALALAASGVPAAEAAVTAGYADQPHFSREVRALAGATVTELLAGEG